MFPAYFCTKVTILVEIKAYLHGKNIQECAEASSQSTDVHSCSDLYVVVNIDY